VIRNLLDGRYDRVRLYPAFLDIYMSAYGKRDTALAWKIDYLIKHGYRALPDIRNGETFYEPSPKLRDVQGLYQCFGPYEAGDLRIAVKEGGGLWCARKGGLDLVDGPNKTSELVLHADSPTTFDVQLRDAGRVRLQPLDGDGRPVADCLEHLPATATVISIRVHPERHDGKCAAGGLTGPGQSRVDVEVDASSVSLVADVAAHVRLTHVRSRGKDVAVKLHDPTPGELNGE
jgi:hypothetical protein